MWMKLCGMSCFSLWFIDLFLIFCIRLLNNNLLEGRVPEKIYSIGVHGGAIEYVIIQFDILHWSILILLFQILLKLWVLNAWLYGWCSPWLARMGQLSPSLALGVKFVGDELRTSSMKEGWCDHWAATLSLGVTRWLHVMHLLDIYLLFFIDKSWMFRVMHLTNELLFLFDSLYGNKGLCGVTPLPDCPLFWENGGLSTKGKIAIGISCGVVFCLMLLMLYIIYVRRRRNDYDFGFPQDLIRKYDWQWAKICQFNLFYCWLYLCISFRNKTFLKLYFHVHAFSRLPFFYFIFSYFTITGKLFIVSWETFVCFLLWCKNCEHLKDKQTALTGCNFPVKMSHGCIYIFLLLQPFTSQFILLAFTWYSSLISFVEFLSNYVQLFSLM